MILREPEKIALFDMDGTLCDYQGELYRWLMEMQSPGDPEINPHELHDVPTWLENRISLIKRQPGWWEGLRKLVDGFEILRACMQIGYSPHILTKGPATTTSAWTEKLNWCQKNLPTIDNRFIPVTVTMDKGLAYGRVLVEDFPPYVERWLTWRRRGVVVLLDRPYNRSFSHPQVVRYTGDNLGEVQVRLQQAYDRQSGE